MNKFRFFSESFSSKGRTDTAGIIVFLSLVAAVIIIILVYNFLKRKYNFRLTRNINIKKRDFFAVSANVGLNSEETRKLFSLIVDQEVKYPMTCFTNAKVLDELLKKGLKDIDDNPKMSEELKNYENSLILEIKAKIESNSRKNIGIRSTRLIGENQKMLIYCRGKGYLYANVRRVMNDHITLQLISDKIDKRLFFLGEHVKIYFWREEDAGYIFETEISAVSDNVAIYNIKHSDKLSRSQKRKYRRVPVSFLGDLYPIYSRVDNNKKVFTIGTKRTNNCRIIDISAGGLKITSDEFDDKENLWKIDFNLNKYRLSAVCRMIRFRQLENGAKEATIQFAKISLRDKNIINRFVYNYMPGYA